MYVLELGGEDDAFAVAEARAASSDVELLAPGVALAATIDSTRIRGLAFTHRASELLGQTPATVERASEMLSDVNLDRAGTVAVRARDVRDTAGVSTEDAERVLGRLLVDRGFTVDLEEPDHELRALFADDVCVLGWLSAESERGFGNRAPTDRPFFQPGSMDPLEARAIANLAGARPGVRVVDPMCGTGGLLLEAGLLGAEVVGSDVQRKMIYGTRRNFRHYLEGEWSVLRADVSHLPFRDESADAAVFDAPYGRQSKIEGDLETVVRRALSDAHRVVDRAVVIADRSLAAVAGDTGWILEDRFERRVHRSLTRHIHVLG